MRLYALVACLCLAGASAVAAESTLRPISEMPIAPEGEVCGCSGEGCEEVAAETS